MKKTHECILLIILISFVGLAAFPAESQNRNPNQIDLNGQWLLEANFGYGGMVTIKQSGQTVNANFDVHSGFCPNTKIQRVVLLNGQLQGNSLTGRVHACTQLWNLIYECGLADVYETTFEATVDKDHIKVRYLAPGYTAKNANRDDWHGCYQDSHWDGHPEFTLTRLTRKFTIKPGLTHTVHPMLGGPEDIVPKQDCPGSLWELVDVDWTATKDNGPIVDIYGNGPAFYQCTYKYYGTWRCPSNGDVMKTMKYQTVGDVCHNFG